MRRTAALFRGLLATLVVALAWPSGGSFAQAATDEDVREKESDLARAISAGGISPDRVVVVYRDASSTTNAVRARVRQQVAVNVLRADTNLGLDIVRASNGNASTLAAQLSLEPDVLSAYPDQVVHASAVATDPEYVEQWGLTRIGAPQAWDVTRGLGTRVAVIDCGIHASHPDLVGQVILAQNFAAATTTDDGCNHGTSVAGTIAALTDNNLGVASVAPGVQLLNGRVLDDSGSGFMSDIGTAIQWAADNGARVISLSLGAPTPCDPGLQRAVDYVWTRGSVLVAAAGNAGAGGAQSPANCKNVIGVAATDQYDALVSWSNHGPSVAIGAPGVGILSTRNPDLNEGAAYGAVSGTSIATAHAAGVAALLWSTNYGTSPAAVRDRLFSTTRTLPESGTAMTFGRLDAAAATAGAATPVAASPPPKPVSVSGLPLAISLPPVVRPFPIDAAAHTAMAVPTAAVAQADQGLNGGWAIDDAGTPTFSGSLTSSLGISHDAGAGWVRMVFRLGACYSNWTTPGCNGRTALQEYDQVIANVRAQNLRVLGILTSESWPGQQSDWTANNAETAGGTGDNSYVRGLAQQASLLAQHFSAQVSEWEVWNEPNAWTSTDGVGHFTGGSYMYPSNYAWLLARSFQAIKSAQPASTVLFGGLFAHEPFGMSTTVFVNGAPQRVTKRGDMPGARQPALAGRALTVSPQVTCASHTPAGSDSGASYLCATYSVGLSYAGWAPGTYPFDDVGQHPYVGLGTTVASTTISTYLQDLRQAYVAYEGASTPKRTQVTEIGWPTDQVSPQVQSDNLRTAFQTLRATSYVGRGYWFTTRDSSAAGLYYGIVDESDVAKPSFATYQQYATFTAPPRPPAPGPCTPRPAVSVNAATGQPGQLRATVTAGSGNLESLQFGAATNALIDIGQVVGGTGNFSVSFAAGTQQVTFIVRRASAGQSTTVPFTANDACGGWSTFVGGGPTAF